MTDSRRLRSVGVDAGVRPAAVTSVGSGTASVDDVTCDLCGGHAGGRRLTDTRGAGDGGKLPTSYDEIPATRSHGPCYYCGRHEAQPAATATPAPSVATSTPSATSAASVTATTLATINQLQSATTATNKRHKRSNIPVPSPATQRRHMLTGTQQQQRNVSMSAPIVNKHATDVNNEHDDSLTTTTTTFNNSNLTTTSEESSGSSSDSSDSDSDSDDSPDEGSYDGVRGEILPTCSDDVSPATHLYTTPSSLPPSLSHEEVIREVIRERYEFPEHLRSAADLLSTFLSHHTDSRAQPWPQHIVQSSAVVQHEWFKTCGGAAASPHDTEDFLDQLDQLSHQLISHVVNLTDTNGNTCLHYAVSHGNFDIVSLLLDSRVCQVSIPNKAGYTAAMLATLSDVRQESHYTVLTRLFSLGDVNQRAAPHGQTALMLAVSRGREDIARLLVSAGAAPDLADCDGSTALMCAAEHGHHDLARLLLDLPDCDATLTDNDGSSALSIAMEAGHKDIGLLIYAHLNFKRQGSSGSMKGRRRHGSSKGSSASSSPATARKSGATQPNK